MNNFFVQAIKIPAHSEGKYKSESWQQDGERWEQKSLPVVADDLNQLLGGVLGVESDSGVTEVHGPWKGSEFVHHIVRSLDEGETFDDYELVRVELQCLRKIKGE